MPSDADQGVLREVGGLRRFRGGSLFL